MLVGKLVGIDKVVGEVVDMEEEGVRAMGDVPSCMNKVSKKITINYHVTL
jgi:hypothetical protein